MKKSEPPLQRVRPDSPPRGQSQPQVASGLASQPRQMLPRDAQQALLVGRVWMPARGATPGGPCIVRVTDQAVYDLTADFPTIAHLINAPDAVKITDRKLADRRITSFDDIAEATLAKDADDSVPRFLPPVDLQPIKASGVTFYDSLLERLIEEKTGGRHETADQVRRDITASLGDGLDRVVPGTQAAIEMLARLRAAGMWSQYLEVAIGTDAEIFTKASPLSCVGPGAAVGILRHSKWNNPEPETVLVVDRRGRIAGATLGNDVNHRDIEGRSALLLGRAKDNNSCCAIGPFVRLIDSQFTIDRLRAVRVDLDVEGLDGFRFSDFNTLSRIRRDIVGLVEQCIGPNNSFPDGVALMLGAMCSIKQDRFGDGSGFTHQPGDLIRVSSPDFGSLSNHVRYCDEVPAWTMGIAELMRNLAQRGLLSRD